MSRLSLTSFKRRARCAALRPESSGLRRPAGRKLLSGILLLATFPFLLAAAEKSAQDSAQAAPAGGIAGTVKDPQKKAVPEAQVALTEISSQKVQTARTDENGAFTFSPIAQGTYALEVTAKGFKTARIQGVKASPHTMTYRDVSLALGEISQVVEVTAQNDFDVLSSPTVAALPESVQIQTTVVTAEEIEAIHPQTVWDIVQQVPGMEVTYQGRQHLDFSYMRGESYRVILDGIYLSQADRLLASLPSDIIESMTVVRNASAISLGPLTSFGGSRGAGNQGFIVIKTKRATKLSGGFTGRMGTYGDVKGTIHQGMKIGSFDYNVAVTYANYDGKDKWFNASHNGSIALRTGFSKWGFNADILYYASRGMREMQYGEILLPTKNKNGTFDYSKVGTLSVSNFSMPYMFSSMVGVNVTRPWSDTQKTTFQYAYNRMDIETTSEQNSREENYNLRHAISFKNNDLTLGGQFLKYYAPTGQAPTNTAQKEGMLGLYIQDEHQLFNNKLAIDAGFRSDKKYYFNSPNTGKPMDEWAKAAYTLSMGALYRPNSIFDIHARFGFSESGMSADQISANGKSLPAEHRLRYEAGVVGNVRSYFKPSLTLFLYDVANEKTTSKYEIDPETGEDLTYVTSADTVTRGAEFAISGKIGDSWTYSTSYTYWISDNDSKNKSSSRQLFSARLGYLYKFFFANWNMNYAGPKYYSNSPAGLAILPMADYTRFDANAGFNLRLLNRATKISFYGRNLGNNHYFTRYVTGAYKDVGLQYGMDLSINFF